MKKWIAVFLAMLLLVGFVGCAAEQSGGDQTVAPEEVPESALEILTNVWEAFPEDKRFSVLGGDMNHAVENAPGVFDLADDGAVYTLLIPETALSQVDSAASLIHSLMRNNFTCSVVHVAEGNTGKDFAKTMTDSVSAHVWDCGAPEMLFVAVVAGEYVVTCYGSGENLELFAAAFRTAYPNAAVQHEDYLG